MKKQISVVCLLGALALPAAAEGVYILGDIGQGKMEADVGNDVFASKTDTTYSIGAGFDINKNFSVELAYRDLGDIHDNDDFSSYRLSATALEASAIAKYPLNQKVDIYGRLGFGKVEFESKDVYHDGNVTVVDKSSDSKYRALFGVGASYALNDNVSLRAEYSQFAEWDDVTLSALTVGATYHF